MFHQERKYYVIDYEIIVKGDLILLSGGKVIQKICSIAEPVEPVRLLRFWPDHFSPQVAINY